MTERFLAERLGDAAVEINLQDIPNDVVVAARRAIFDTIGVMVAGYSHPTVVRYSKSIRHVSGTCSVRGLNKTSAESAALINGMASHAWDFDDTSYTGIMHGSAVIFPACLAIAEETGASESELLCAYVIGCEVAYQVAELCSHTHYFAGWFSSATFGILGATAAVARLVQCSTTETTRALTLAASSAGASRSILGCTGKPYIVGETAQRAIGFVRAAKVGVSGPLDVFENNHGFLKLFSAVRESSGIDDHIGRPWRLVKPGLFIKTSPVCSAAHAAIEQVAQLKKYCDCQPSDIAEIVVEVPELVNISLVYSLPKDQEQAQFSLPYAIACGIKHGRVRLDDLTYEEICDKGKKRLMEKTTVTVSKYLSSETMRRKYPESARVTMKLQNGECASEFCGEAYGMPGRPLKDRDLVAKFMNNVKVSGLSEKSRAKPGDNLLTLATSILNA